METKPTSPATSLDFQDTSIAYAHKSDSELKKTAWLFSMMNKAWLVEILNPLGLKAVQWNLPFARTIIKNTIFEQFVGGTSLEDSKKAIDHLAKTHVRSVLDFGAEGKESDEDFQRTVDENLREINFAGKNPKWVPVVSTKVTGFARFGLLEEVSANKNLSPETAQEWKKVCDRLDALCKSAHDQGVSVYIDAEESWIQPALDELVMDMMTRYNSKRVVVFNTYQMYRHDRNARIRADHERAQRGGFFLGAKLVRGAYMDKERERAAAMGYPDPINPDKAATDREYNTAVEYVVKNYQTIGSCCATHNAESSLLQARLMDELGIPHDHPHLFFCQLYGMSDNLTFNLAKAGYNAGKYLVYGPVKDVVPYLIRRARENTSVTGDMSRELQLVTKELLRRKTAGK